MTKINTMLTIVTSREYFVTKFINTCAPIPSKTTAGSSAEDIFNKNRESYCHY